MAKVRKSIMLDADNYKLAKSKGWNVSTMLDKALAKLLTGELVLSAASEKIKASDEYMASKIGELAKDVAAHTKALKHHNEQIKILRRHAGLSEVETT